MPLTTSNTPPADRPMANAIETADDNPGEKRAVTHDDELENLAAAFDALDREQQAEFLRRIREAE